jgi:hypothetical protein
MHVHTNLQIIMCTKMHINVYIEINVFTDKENYTFRC